MTFSDQLHQLRAELHITQREAYTALEVPRRTYEDWERGQRTPPEYLQRIILRQLEQTKEPSL